jgi:GNAT superfamily N-acetyltransferase
MIIDRLAESDLPAALRLSTQAGWNHVEADLRRLLELWPAGYFVGRRGSEVVASTSLAIHGGHVGWVGLVLVDEAHRRQGLGGEIFDAMLDAAQDAGVKTLGLDATDLGRPLYLTKGFRDVATVERWLRPAGNGELTSHPPIALTSHDSRQDSSAWNDILAMDRHAIRLDRSALLNHFRNEQEVRCQSIRSPQLGTLLAFAMIRPGRIASHIGPVIGDSEAAAEAVLDQLLQDVEAKQPVFIDVPPGRLKNWLAVRGFALSRSVVRMQAGIRGPDLLGPRVFAVCGFELG